MLEDKTRYHIANDYIDNPLKFDGFNLIQIGRRFCEPSAVVLPHTHMNWFELTIVTGGEGYVITNDDKCKVKSGDIYLSFPYEIHAIHADDKNKLEYDFFSFNCEDEKLNGFFKEITISHRAADSRIFNDENIVSLIRNAISEFSANELFFNEVINSILKQVIIYIVRNFNYLKINSPDVSNAEILCLQLMNYIDTHIYSLYNLCELTNKFKYNYSYLSALFKKTTDKTLAEYFRTRKLETAKALILEKKKKVGEIAEMLNYSSTFAFSKAFKEKYGVPPTKI